MESNLHMNRNSNVFMIASSFYFILCLILLNRKMIIFDALTYFGLLFSNVICIYTAITSVVEKTNNFFQQHIINFIMNTVILNTMWKNINGSIHFTYSNDENNSYTADLINSTQFLKYIIDTVNKNKEETKNGYDIFSVAAGVGVGAVVVYGIGSV